MKKQKNNYDRARTTIQALIGGVDPVSGADLPNESVLQNAGVIRALLTACTALEEMSSRAARRAKLPEGVGKTWTPAEEQKLIAAFNRGSSVQEIASAHKRTIGAIEARLEKFRLITAEQRTAPYSWGSRQREAQ
jgi:hypothetical protein